MANRYAMSRSDQTDTAGSWWDRQPPPPTKQAPVAVAAAPVAAAPSQTPPLTAPVIKPPTGQSPAIEQGGIAGTNNRIGGTGKFAGMDPQAAWQQAVAELGLSGTTPQDKATLDRVAQYLAANGLPGITATGADTINVPGIGSVDVLTAGNQWWWSPEGASGGGGGGVGGPSMGDLFAGYQGGSTAGFGAPPPPYASQAWTGGSWQPPALPANLQQPYQAPVWGEQFTAPTMAQAMAEPGYQTRLATGEQALERSAAARGTLLGGGQQKALTRYGQDFGANEYQNVYGRAMGEYLNKYGEFLNAANMGLGARQQNLGEYQSQAGLGQQAFQNRYGIFQGENARTLSDYLTNAAVQRNAQGDYWQRLQDLYQGGLTGIGTSKTPTPVISG